MDFSEDWGIGFDVFDHLVGCQCSSKHRGRRIGEKAVCTWSNSDGSSCRSKTFPQGCREKIGEVYFGFCKLHWSFQCQMHGWDPNLSRCVNLVADTFRMPLEERGTINQYTIREMLGLRDSHNHLSASRRAQARNERNAINQYSVSGLLGTDRHNHLSASRKAQPKKERKTINKYSVDVLLGAPDSHNHALFLKMVEAKEKKRKIDLDDSGRKKKKARKE